MRINLILAFFFTMLIFRAVNYAPLFSATLCEIMASHGFTQVRAAEISGLGRNILVRLSSGEQWPHAEHLGGVAKIAATPEERMRLVDAISSDCAAASGVDRFTVAEDAGHSTIRVPVKYVGLIENALLLAQCNPTGAIALKGVVDSLLPGVIHAEALKLDAEEFRKPEPAPVKKPRKNVAAPSARSDFPPRSKAS